ncbi:Succinate dehydrogenase/fumarate reductase iron-sulfur prot [Anopheles sinensis]|uniref:Succinate dehydrogenase/fumarate reductase iron-sulfur prot n=1 Tax=Anopheles sinensis TaxID=74873 RepID=A0A084VED4_ANOSI|nr:Succinate dehydrogenase/fumarate reductase iron-sulfur prot [Anopheles sinensis]
MQPRPGGSQGMCQKVADRCQIYDTQRQAGSRPEADGIAQAKCPRDPSRSPVIHNSQWHGTMNELHTGKTLQSFPPAPIDKSDGSEGKRLIENTRSLPREIFLGAAISRG